MIMKKKALALAIILTASASDAATVYDKDDTSLNIGGRVQSVFYNTGAAKANELNKGNDNTLVNSARFSLEGRSKINSNVSAFAFSEWDMANGTDENLKTREQFVGLDFNSYGRLMAGKTYSAMKSVIEVTDIFEDFGCVGQFGEDEFRSGTIRYVFENDSFFASVSTSLASDNELVEGASYNEFDKEDKVNIKGGFAASVGYTFNDVLFGPLSFKAGYEYIKVQNKGVDNYEYGIHDISAPALKNVKDIAASVKWGSDEGFSVGALYNTRKFTLTRSFINDCNNAFGDDVAFSYRLNGYEIVTAYGFENGITIAAGYEFMEVKGDHKGNSEIFRRIPVYVNYDLNENFNLWTEAQFNAGDEHKSSELNKSLLSVGARYTF